MLLSPFSSLFCQTPFAGLLLRQGDKSPTSDGCVPTARATPGRLSNSFWTLRGADAIVAAIPPLLRSRV